MAMASTSGWSPRFITWAMTRSGWTIASAGVFHQMYVLASSSTAAALAVSQPGQVAARVGGSGGVTVGMARSYQDEAPGAARRGVTAEALPAPPPPPPGTAAATSRSWW